MMELSFQPTKGNQFTMEIGYFDSVLEIKEKVEKYRGIPVSKQTLMFNGQVLPDDLNVHSSEILDGSSIQLQLPMDDADETATRIIKEEEEHQEVPLPPPSTKIQILLKMPTSKQARMVEMEENDAVRHLKQRIQEMEGIPLNRLVLLHAKGYEYHDNNRLLRDYLLSEDDRRLEMDIAIRPSPAPAPASSSSTGSAGNGNSNGNNNVPNPKKLLRVMVLTKCGNRKIAVEVRASDKVGELKKELLRLQPRLQFNLPAEGYFFIYKQNVMEEDRSFRWHQVNQGDTIEIFGGTVSGGGS